MLLPLIILLVATSNALIGYDCGGQHLNVTTISLLGAGDCDLRINTPNHTDTYIQLLQLSEYNYAEVMQCKVEIQRTAYYCGMHSHISAVRKGQAEYIEETHYERCKRMHQDGILTLGFNEDSTIKGIKQNQTMTYGVTFAGTIKPDGECKGTSYTDPYGSWDDVIVQGIVRISLKTSYVPVHLSTGKIFLKSGTVCELSNGYCIDSDHGYTFWTTTPTTTCDFQQYDVLYEGPAIKMRDETAGQYQPLVYSLTTQEITFALSVTKEQPICGYTLKHTEHPKLFILETQRGNAPKPIGNIPVDNLDIFAYVNSKFVYVEKHIRTQMTALYHNVMQQRCELEAEVLRNTLSFATLLPDEFAYRLMKGPGYMAVTAGEAIHVVKCIPVDVTARRTQECYQELPVNVRNISLYITPKSRILTKIGMQRECSHELPTLYRIEDTWVQLLPEPHVYPVAPQQLQPLTKITWKYLTPGPLASSGIYSKQEIDRLRDHIMFPAEKPALLNSVARGINGYSMGGNSPPLHQLLDEDALAKIAKSTAAKLWGGFLIFGSATAGVIGIFVIIRIIKIIIDTAIHGYALHTVYGCGFQLLGALWSSVTHLLLHLAHAPPQRKGKDSGEKEAEEGRQLDPSQGATTVAPAPAPALPINRENIILYKYSELKRKLDEMEEDERILPTTSGIRSTLRREM